MAKKSRPTLTICTVFVSYVASGDRFSFTDLTDKNNEPTIMDADGGKRSIPRVYDWLVENSDRLATLKFQDVTAEFCKMGIKYHRYYAMD